LRPGAFAADPAVGVADQDEDLGCALPGFSTLVLGEAVGVVALGELGERRTHSFVVGVVADVQDLERVELTE
jgi:hypothetical protein